MKAQTSNGTSRILVLLFYVIMPILLSILIVLFIVNSFDMSTVEFNRRNQLSVAAFIFYYLGGALLFYAINRQIGGWIKLFSYSGGGFIVFCLVVSFPFYFLLTLPFSVFYFLQYLGSPKTLWEKLFDDTIMSFMNFEEDQNICSLLTKGLYIGIPYVIFLILYVIVSIILFPVLLLLFSPLIGGPWGISYHFALRNISTIEETMWDNIENSHILARFLVSWVLSFPMIIISGMYYFLVMKTNQSLYLFGFSILYFLINGITSMMSLFCDSSAIQIV